MKSKKVGLKFGGYQKCVYLCTRLRDVAQLVAHASGGREVASSSLFNELAFLFSLISNFLALG